MTDFRVIRPEDVLSDTTNTVEVNGMDVRKGTAAAFVANVKLLDSLPEGSLDRAPVEAQLRALTPALQAIGLLDVFAPRSAEIAALIGVPR